MNKEKLNKNQIPPTVEMVAEYCKERNNGIDAQEFCDHYVTVGWFVGKKKMVDWQGAVRTWENLRRKKGLLPAKNQSEKRSVPRFQL